MAFQPGTAKKERPLGATDGCPLVVKTEDIARFLAPRLAREPMNALVERIKICRELGRITTAPGYDVVKRISQCEKETTSDNAAESILITEGAPSMLGNDIPLYRNPYLGDKGYISSMKKRLKYNWDDELDGPWNEREQMEYILSFPKLHEVSANE